MKIVVPIMPKNLEEAQSIDISKFDEVDIIEWRADFLDKDDIMTVAPAILKNFQVEKLFLPFVRIRKVATLTYLTMTMLSF